jgi:hypothetical protein
MIFADDSTVIIGNGTARRGEKETIPSQGWLNGRRQANDLREFPFLCETRQPE